MVHEWWKFWRYRAGMERVLGSREAALAFAQTSSTLLPVRVVDRVAFSHTVVVVALEDFASLSVLSSALHGIWIFRYGVTFGAGLRYTPTDVFANFPRPEPTPDLHRVGERLDSERRTLMLGRGWGLTRTYNAVHDPAVRDPEVVALRDLHAEIDAAVLAAYGWHLDLEIGHHPTKIGTRWTVSRRARFELLDLLLEENHRRAGLLP